ncbi:ATP-binding cassette domain-containing protein [bacterium]|nr:ATP-binding cassette domain-containing protein [bacterium]
MEIKMKNVDYVYKKINYQEKLVLKNINIKFDCGKINVIIGAPGSGKSTLLNLLNQELIPTKGKIIVDQYTITNNNDLKNIDRSIIGFVLQNPSDQFFNSTVREELIVTMQMNNYIPNQMNKRILDVLKMVHLEEDTLIRNPNSLSESEKRKLAIAQALICNPKILVLDEPVNSFDEKTKEEYLKLFRLLTKRYNKTIIIASNDLNFVHKIADKVFVLNQNEIVLQGDKYEVFKDTRLLKKYGLIPPYTMLFSNLVKEKKNIKIGYRDEINDLIKDIYRYVK